MTRMLTLFIPIRNDAMAQGVAEDIRQGFNTKEWTALRTFGVLDARLTAIPDPAEPKRSSAILLCTTYQGGVRQYYEFFWNLLRRPFVALAMASIAPPFQLNPQQMAALGSGDDSPEALASLDPLFEAFSDWVDRNNLTAHVEAPDVPPLPNQRNQFRLEGASW